MSKQVYNDKTLGRVYAFKFIYHLFLKEFAADKAAVIEDEKKLLELISEFEESYMTQDWEIIYYLVVIILFPNLLLLVMIII